jgi:hypothetical protein
MQEKSKIDTAASTSIKFTKDQNEQPKEKQDTKDKKNNNM